jgi:hypothetical protein
LRAPRRAHHLRLDGGGEVKRRIADAGWIVFTTAFLALLAATACHQQVKLDEQIEHHESLEIDAGLHIEEEEHQHANLDAHTIETDAPTETADRDFALRPDGGTYLAHEHVVLTGPRQIEAWQLAQIGADEHVGVDAHLAVTSHDDDKLNLHTEKTTDAGSIWTGIKIGAAMVLVVLILVGAFLAYRKLRKEIPFP